MSANQGNVCVRRLGLLVLAVALGGSTVGCKLDLGRRAQRERSAVSSLSAANVPAEQIGSLPPPVAPAPAPVPVLAPAPAPAPVIRTVVVAPAPAPVKPAAPPPSDAECAVLKRTFTRACTEICVHKLEERGVRGTLRDKALVCAGGCSSEMSKAPALARCRNR